MSREKDNVQSLDPNKIELGRKLGLWAAVAISVGTTVGSGIFSSVGEVAGAGGSAIITILAFFTGFSSIACKISCNCVGYLLYVNTYSFC